MVPTLQAAPGFICFTRGGTNFSIITTMKNKTDLGEPFNGTVIQMKNTPWFASEDLMGLPECVFTISDVRKHENVTFDKGRKEPLVYSLGFSRVEKADDGADRTDKFDLTKRLVLNSTNRRSIAAMYGASVAAWKGKAIQLYIDPNVEKPGGKRGEVTNGIRVRGKKVDASDFALPKGHDGNQQLVESQRGGGE